MPDLSEPDVTADPKEALRWIHPTKFHVPGLYPFIKQLLSTPQIQVLRKFKVDGLRQVAIDFQTSPPPYS